MAKQQPLCVVRLCSTTEVQAFQIDGEQLKEVKTPSCMARAIDSFYKSTIAPIAGDERKNVQSTLPQLLKVLKENQVHHIDFSGSAQSFKEALGSDLNYTCGMLEIEGIEISFSPEVASTATA